MSKPLVSISLLCSNRKNTIRKCLDSLQPLRDAVDAELVIVDTGCDEETKAILKEYTDQVVDFEWCNDFSKARNAGLEKCRGEWFLFIDDDEWFIDMDEIIDFFLSGRYKKYHHAMYMVRNYADYSERFYDDAWVSRMIRIEKDTKFVSSIHEYFSPAIGEPAMLHSIAKHFGYVFESKAARYKHSERNISLLWDMIEKEHNAIRWWAHLIQEYFIITEYNKLIEVCNEALEIFRKSDRFIDVRDKAVFYVGRMWAANCLHQVERAKEFYEEAIADPKLLPVARGAIYKVGAQIYYTLGNIKKCRDCGQRYIEIYEQYIQDEQELQKQNTFLVKNEYLEKAFCSLMSIMVSINLKEENFDEAIHCFRKMNWENEKKEVYEKFFDNIVNSFAIYECNDALVEIAQTLMIHKGIAPIIIEKVQKQKDIERVAEVFSHVESEHYYISYLKILYSNQINDSTYLQEYYKKIFSCVLDVLNFDDRFWEIAKKYEVDLDSLIMDIPFDRWKAAVNRLCEKNPMKMIQKRFDILCQMQQTSNIRYDYFELKVSEATLVYTRNTSFEDEQSEAVNSDDEQKSTNEIQNANQNQESSKIEEDYNAYRAKIYDFVEKSLLFYQKFYTEAAFEGEMEMLPASCRAAVKLYDALAAEKHGDYKKVLEDLKAIIGVYPPLDATIQKYSKLYGQMVVEKRFTSKVSSEMLELAKKLKQKAQELLDAGDVENAEMILRQVSMYCQNS